MLLCDCAVVMMLRQMCVKRALQLTKQVWSIAGLTIIKCCTTTAFQSLCLTVCFHCVRACNQLCKACAVLIEWCKYHLTGGIALNGEGKRVGK